MIDGFDFDGRIIPFPDVIGRLGRPLWACEKEALEKVIGYYEYGAQLPLCILLADASENLAEIDDIKWAIRRAMSGNDVVQEWVLDKEGVDILTVRYTYRQEWARHILASSEALEGRK